MSNFDLRKFLAEGKLYEEATSTEEAMDKPSTKMKMSELKKKIREEILSELTLNEDDKFSVGGAETQADVDFYGGLEEATKDGDGEVPSKDKNTDIDIEDKEEVEVDVEKKPKMSTTDSEFLDQLEDLKDEADAMGDSKLERQVDNTITYFTRQHIAANESIELEEADAPINIVTTTDGKTIVGTHQYGVGFKSNETGKKMGFKDNPTSIPNGTKMTKADELEEANDMALIADLEAALTEGEEYDDYDLNVEFKKSPDKASYEDVLDIIDSYEDEEVLNDFKAKFPEGEPISKKDYSDFAIDYIDDMSEVGFIQANWISIFDENVFDKAGLVEGDSEFQRVDRGDEDVTAKNKAEEKVYGAGVKKGEEIEKKKLKTESLEILKMKKLAGLLTEGEYAKALLRENIEQDIATAAKPKIENLMSEPRTEMIDGVLHIDFDDIGTLWSEVFEEVFKREMNDLIDQDVDDFEKVQNIVMGMITNNGEIEYEFDY